MKITVNGDERTLGGPLTLADLIEQFQLVPQRVAIEVNEQLVRRGDFGQTKLNPGDRVEIVTLVGGG